MGTVNQMCFVPFLVQNHSKRKATFVFSVMCPTSVAQATDFCGNRANRFLGYSFAFVLSRFGAKPFENENTFVFSVTCPTSALRSTYFGGNQVNHYFK